MIHPLTAQTANLHGAAGALFIQFLQELPQPARARIENLKGCMRVDVTLDVHAARIEFVHQSQEGGREILGAIAVPPEPHKGAGGTWDCTDGGEFPLCVECEEKLRQTDAESIDAARRTVAPPI